MRKWVSFCVGEIHESSLCPEPLPSFAARIDAPDIRGLVALSQARSARSLERSAMF